MKAFSIKFIVILYFPHRLSFEAELFDSIKNKYESEQVEFNKAIEAGSLWFSLYEHIDRNRFVYMFWNWKFRLPDSVKEIINDSKSRVKIIYIKTISNLRNLFVNVTKNFKKKFRVILAN